MGTENEVALNFPHMLDTGGGPKQIGPADRWIVAQVAYAINQRALNTRVSLSDNRRLEAGAVNGLLVG